MIKTCFKRGDILSSVSNKVGRPVGKVKTAKIEILVEPIIKEKFMTILKTHGKNASSEICGWIHEYINNFEENA